MELIEKGMAYHDQFGRTAVVEEIYSVADLGRCVSARVIPAEDSENEEGAYKGRISDFLKNWKSERL